MLCSTQHSTNLQTCIQFVYGMWEDIYRIYSSTMHTKSRHCDRCFISFSYRHKFKTFPKKSLLQENTRKMSYVFTQGFVYIYIYMYIYGRHKRVPTYVYSVFSLPIAEYVSQRVTFCTFVSVSRSAKTVI